MLRESELLAVDVIQAIRCGDGGSLRLLLTANPGLTQEYIESADGSSRTLLHVVTDWPGFFPNGPAITRMLTEAGADPDARTRGAGCAEAPLHRTASSDDAGVAAVLIDAGADIELPDGSIGTPLDNAIGYGCWNVARLLVRRGARVDKLWHAAALGIHDRLLDLLGESPPSEGAPSEGRPREEALTEAFFLACGGGQRRAAELLLARAVGRHSAPGLGAQREQLVEWLRTHGAQPPGGSLSRPRRWPVPRPSVRARWSPSPAVRARPHPASSPQPVPGTRAVLVALSLASRSPLRAPPVPAVP